MPVLVNLESQVYYLVLVVTLVVFSSFFLKISFIHLTETPQEREHKQGEWEREKEASC